MLAEKQNKGRLGQARATLVRAMDVFDCATRATRRSLPKLFDPTGTQKAEGLRRRRAERQAILPENTNPKRKRGR